MRIFIKVVSLMEGLGFIVSTPQLNGSPFIALFPDVQSNNRTTEGTETPKEN